MLHPVRILSRWLLLAAALPLSAAAEDAYVEGEVLVTFRPDVAETSARTRVAGRSMRLAETYDRISAARGRVHGMVRDKSRTTADLIAELKTDPTVETVEPNYLRKPSFVRPDDTYFPRQWNLENTGQYANVRLGTSGADSRFIQAWNLSRTTAPAQEIVIVVADTGVDIMHPDLAPNIWTNTAEVAGNGIDDDGNGRIDDVHGFDFVLNTSSVADSSDHGTHVAGIAAAAGRNGAGICGAQFKVKILPLKISSNGTDMPASAILAAYNYALAMKQRGVNIVAYNASYGGTSSSVAESNAISTMRDRGIILCAAAGNDARDSDATPEYPAAYTHTNIISVAAVNARDTLSTFSNYGKVSVDLAAPGTDIFSTSPLSKGGTEVSVTLGSARYPAAPLEFSPVTPLAGLTRTIYHCGTGEISAAFPAGVSGNIALIRRGNNTFADKVTRAKAAGAVAVIIYNNVDEDGSFTLGASSSAWIPAVEVSLDTGNAIIASAPVSGTVVSALAPAFPYQYMNGTSMAAPHVTAAVAFAALNFPSETLDERVARVLNNTTPLASLNGKTVKGGRLNLLKMIDTDEDGLPDWWETENFGSLAPTATDDPDGDGFNNLTEFRGGTNPKSSSSHLAISSMQPSGSDLLLSFPANAEQRYQIEWSNTLTPPWTPLGGPVTGTGANIQITDPGAFTASPQRFYRLNLLSE